MSVKKLRIHLLVQAPGPIQSGPGGDGLRIGTRSTWRCACDAAITMGELNRGTTEPWAVRCNACRETEAFHAIDRPRPGWDGRYADLQADGCC